MNRSRAWVVLLGIAGLLECSMAIAHFGLQWEWRGVDFTGIPAQLAWALFALNFSWAVLLLAVGSLVLYAAAGDSASAFVQRLMIVLGAFWAIHGAYITIIPMPLPERLSWLRAPLLAFPATLIALHWTAVVLARRSSSRERLHYRPVSL